jgi:glutamate dehydrogenase (NAD(P)+)
VTGKPVIVGGSQPRRTATGAGLVFCLRRAAELVGLPRPLRVAIHGYGNVGRAAAELLAQSEDVLVVAIADVDGAVHDPRGLDVAAVGALLDRGTPLPELPFGEAIPRDTLFELDCDVLAPCSVAGVLHAGNAGRVRARVVVEGANGPTTAAADRIFADGGVTVVPDILTNSGGVIVSYYEWVQALQAMSWSRTEVASRLEQRITTALDDVTAFASAHALDLRAAALCMAVKRVADVHLARGLYP